MQEATAAQSTPFSAGHAARGFSERHRPLLFRRVFVDGGRSVGQTMSAARTGLGRSIGECARRVTVPERYLRAIEQEDFSALPGLVYEKHFVARYAAYLGLNTHDLVASWVELRDYKPQPEFVERVRWWNLRSTPLAWRRLLMGFLLICLALFVAFRLLAVAAPPLLAVSNPAPGQVVFSPEFVVTGSIDPGVTVTVNGQPVVVDANGVFSLPVVLTGGPNTIRVKAEKRHGKASIIERQVFYNPTDQIVGLSL